MVAPLLRRTGHDVPWWVAAVRAQAPADEAAARTWLLEQGVTGYGHSVVMWELYGYPDFLVKDAAELLAGQYADRPQLRPVADAVIALVQGWADDGTGQVSVTVRKTYTSLSTPRRKFAQLTPAGKSAVDLLLRLDEPTSKTLLAVTARRDDGLMRKVRLRTPDDLTGEVVETLLRAYRANL